MLWTLLNLDNPVLLTEKQLLIKFTDELISLLEILYTRCFLLTLYTKKKLSTKYSRFFQLNRTKDAFLRFIPMDCATVSQIEIL